MTHRLVPLVLVALVLAVALGACSVQAICPATTTTTTTMPASPTTGLAPSTGVTP
ncbi:MAG: hypothetical protein U0U69_07045 [Acidimicrobiia bacterium]